MIRWDVVLERGRVRIREFVAATPSDDATTFARVLQDGRDRVRADFAQAGPLPDAWTLEYAKAMVGDGEVAIGFVQRLAQGLADGGRASVAAPGAWLSRRALAAACAARGWTLHEARTARLVDGLGYLGACFVALATILATLSRHAGAGRGVVPEGDTAFALHGESSTRTRHLLAQLGAVRPCSIFVIGRPRESLDGIAALWARDTTSPLPPLVRPLGWRAALAALPSWPRLLREGARRGRECAWLPPLRERAAIVYRVLLGSIAAEWWHRRRPAVRTVLYGHTGPADATLLELAQQAHGVRTIHVVHGVSGGINFTGRSSEARWRCAHDARWHERLGGYGACTASPAPLPEPPGGDAELLLVSNLAHPMHPGYRAFGLAEETAALHMTAQAARELSATAWRWKPHPVFANLPAPQQAELRGLAQALGFEVLPATADWRDAARRSRWVVATASTAVIELLELGRMPVMLASSWLDRDGALARHPLVAGDAAALAAALSRLRAGNYGDLLLAQAWDAIGPAQREPWS
jgi:hypothetical protein